MFKNNYHIAINIRQKAGGQFANVFKLMKGLSLERAGAEDD